MNEKIKFQNCTNYLEERKERRNWRRRREKMTEMRKVWKGKPWKQRRESGEQREMKTRLLERERSSGNGAKKEEV